MQDNDIYQLVNLDGFVSACIFDAETGEPVLAEGENQHSFEELGPLMCEVMQAHASVPDYYGADPERKAEEIIFTLGKQVHMMRPLARDADCFAHLVLDRAAMNVGHARLALKRFDMALAAAA